MHGKGAYALLGLLVITMLIHVPSAHSQEEDDDDDGNNEDNEVVRCSLTEFDPKCSPSGWVAFIIGDVTLAIIIAAMIYYLQKRTNTKLSEAIMFTQKVLKQEEESKKRQIVFVTQSLKNYFSGIMMIAGLMNHYLVNVKAYEDIPETIRGKKDYMTTMASHTSDTLNLATHILDPVLTEQVRRFVTTIENISPESGVGKGFPRYEVIKNEIASITAKLDACVGNEDKILK